MFRNVVVGISGGVDSAMAAFLLKEKGYNVLGVFMKNWDEYDEKGRCSGEQDLLDAEYTCKKLDIELRQINYVKDYWNTVFTKFLQDYENGLTPNPDILCNRYIKFDLFHKYAMEQLKCDAIATGHYAKSSFGTYLEKFNDKESAQLLIPKDTFKDQTFFLSGVRRNSLSRAMFPLDNYLKDDVKHMARKCGLTRLANKKESTGICFVGQRNFKDFIEEYIHSKPGNFLDIDSHEIVGQHAGIHQWTVGQRCRLHSFLKPYFVAHKDVATNTIFVAAGTDHPALYSDRIFAEAPNWLCDEPFVAADNFLMRCRFRFQHTKPLVDCTLYKADSESTKLLIVLDKPLRAITPGQYAVFYSDNSCLGSARIISGELTNHDRKLDLNNVSNCRQKLNF